MKKKPSHLECRVAKQLASYDARDLWYTETTPVLLLYDHGDPSTMLTFL